MRKKTERLNVRLTPGEKRALERLAKRDDLSVAEFLVAFIRREARLKGINT